MQVQGVNYSTPSFGALKLSNNVPDLLKEAVNKSKAFQNFGKKFDANVEYVSWRSGSTTDTNIYPSIMLRNVKPANFFTKLKMFMSKIKVDNMVDFGIKTHRIPTDEHLAEKIENLPESHLLDKFKGVFSTRTTTHSQLNTPSTHHSHGGILERFTMSSYHRFF